MKSKFLIFLILALLAFIIFQYIDGKNLSAKLKLAEAATKASANDAATAYKRAEESEAREQKLRAEAKQERDSLLKDIADLQSEKNIIAENLIAEKAKTALLTDSKLAAIMCEYIGTDNAREQKTGGFSLTRVGGENTVNIFKEHTSNLAMWEKDKLSLAKAKSTIYNYETVTIPSFEREVQDKDDAIDKGKTAYSDISRELSLVKKDARKKFWKGLACGAGGTGLVVLFVNLLSGLGH